MSEGCLADIMGEAWVGAWPLGRAHIRNSAFVSPVTNRAPWRPVRVWPLHRIAMTDSGITIELTSAQVDRVVRSSSDAPGVPNLLRELAERGTTAARFRTLAQSPRMSRSLLLGLLVLTCFPPRRQRPGGDRPGGPARDEPEHDAPLPDDAAGRGPDRAGPAHTPLQGARRRLAAHRSAAPAPPPPALSGLAPGPAPAPRARAPGVSAPHRPRRRLRARRLLHGRA